METAQWFCVFHKNGNEILNLSPCEAIYFISPRSAFPHPLASSSGSPGRALILRKCLLKSAADERAGSPGKEIYSPSTF